MLLSVNFVPAVATALSLPAFPLYLSISFNHPHTDTLAVCTALHCKQHLVLREKNPHAKKDLAEKNDFQLPFRRKVGFELGQSGRFLDLPAVSSREIAENSKTVL